MFFNVAHGFIRGIRISTKTQNRFNGLNNNKKGFALSHETFFKKYLRYDYFTSIIFLTETKSPASSLYRYTPDGKLTPLNDIVYFPET